MCSIYCGYLQAGVDVNLQDDIGDTPLHKAAFTGEKVKKKKNMCKSGDETGLPALKLLKLLSQKCHLMPLLKF